MRTRHKPEPPLTDRTSQDQLNREADEIIQVMTLTSAMRSRAQKGNSDEPSELEFLALDILKNRGTLSVGEIQREIGILPAQMSRLVRSLEAKGGGLVKCAINDKDRRKIDVTLTKAGNQAHQHYVLLRRVTSLEFLKILNAEDRSAFMRVIRQFRTHVSNLLKNK
ncbi:MAG: MarR family winged helix-turn-helix transcriptional regulator [Phycisphaerae bacterium]